MFRYSGILSGLKGNACENFRRNGTLNLQFLTQKMKRNNFVPFERKSTAVFSITNRYHIPSTEHSSRSIINQLEHCLFGISDLAKERGKENENRNTSEIVLLFLEKKKTNYSYICCPTFHSKWERSCHMSSKNLLFARDWEADMRLLCNQSVPSFVDQLITWQIPSLVYIVVRKMLFILRLAVLTSQERYWVA